VLSRKPVRGQSHMDLTSVMRCYCNPRIFPLPLRERACNASSCIYTDRVRGWRACAPITRLRRGRGATPHPHSRYRKILDCSPLPQGERANPLAALPFAIGLPRGGRGSRPSVDSRFSGEPG
jgi:hypothetical protein